MTGAPCTGASHERLISLFFVRACAYALLRQVCITPLLLLLLLLLLLRVRLLLRLCLLLLFRKRKVVLRFFVLDFACAFAVAFDVACECFVVLLFILFSIFLF